jgi:RNA polymerase sigma-70 factor (ECF subfamily)
MDERERSASEGFRDELRIFCYRMSGSLREAEDLAETTLFRASGLPISFADTAATRTELLKLATRICLEALMDRPARVLPSVSNPPSDPFLPPLEPEEDDFWLEPFPDDLDPERDYANGKRGDGRDGISLRFIAALQEVQPRARISLVIADVMGWPVNSLAEVLGIGVVDARRTLDEARESFARAHAEEAGGVERPDEEKEAALSMRYLYAWEAEDVESLAGLFSENISIQLPPSPSWYEGREDVVHYLSSRPLASGSRGRWRLLPRRANGELAFGVYERGEERDRYIAHTIQVLRFEGTSVREVISFAYPDLFKPFRLMPEVTAR